MATPLRFPLGGVTWTPTNAAFAANVGNTGNVQAGTVSTASVNASGVLTAGTVPGQVSVIATIGSVNSAPVVTQIFGVPSKIIMNPDTAASVIAGATGEYLFGSVGATQPASFTLQDSTGHTDPVWRVHRIHLRVLDPGSDGRLDHSGRR